MDHLPCRVDQLIARDRFEGYYYYYQSDRGAVGCKSYRVYSNAVHSDNCTSRERLVTRSYRRCWLAGLFRRG